MVRRDVKSRYAGSRFGVLWSFLNPLVQLASYALIFGYVYRPAEGTERGPFLAALFCGLWSWWAFQEGTMRGLTSLVDQAPLLKRAPLPAELCIAAAVTASFVLQTLGFCLSLAVFAAAGLIEPSARLALLPAGMLLGLALTVSVALVLAPIYLVVRDTINVVTAALTLGFFASPVLYRIEALPEHLRPLAELNPLSGVIGLYRLAVLGIPLSSATPIAIGIGAFVVCWAVGSLFLSRLAGLLDEYW